MAISKRNASSVAARIYIQDATKSDGSGLTGLIYNSSGLKASYSGDGQPATAITLVAATVGSFTSGGFVEIDPANLPGWYEVGLPNAMLAYAAPTNRVQLILWGAANMVRTAKEFDLVAYDPQDALHLGVSALPAQAAGASGGLALGDSAGNALLSVATEAAIAASVAGAILATPANKLATDSSGNVAANNIPSGSAIAADVLDAAQSAHTIVGTVGASINSAATGTGLTTTQIANAVWDTLTAAHATAGSFGVLLEGLAASVAAAILSTPTNKLATDASGAVAINNGISASAVTSAVLDAALAGHSNPGTAGAALGNLIGALAESYAANGQPGTLAQLLYAIQAMMMNVSQSGTTLTAQKLDGATQAMSFTLDNAAAPTSRKRAA